MKTKMRLLKVIVILGFTVLCMQACTSCEQKKPQTTSTQDTSPVVDLVKKGKQSYQTNCIACHNSNPKLDGSMGPRVFGSSLELLRARIVHGNYPEGYTPLRKTKIMVALPHVEKDLDALYAYLNEP